VSGLNIQQKGFSLEKLSGRLPIESPPLQPLQGYAHAAIIDFGSCPQLLQLHDCMLAAQDQLELREIPHRVHVGDHLSLQEMQVP
jgi:hypothetical protein